MTIAPTVSHPATVTCPGNPILRRQSLPCTPLRSARNLLHHRCSTTTTSFCASCSFTVLPLNCSPHLNFSPIRDFADNDVTLRVDCDTMGVCKISTLVTRPPEL